MYRRARDLAFVTVAVIFFGISAAAQVQRPTPTPTITAENEPWFLNGSPITYAGSLYYPAGAQVFFSPNEMVRSGFHLGIPLYSRTTVEPFSIVYVPVAGGFMQPYERPRAGDLAGTSGSRPAAATTPYEITPDGPAPLQAPAPPTQTAYVASPGPVAVGTSGAPAAPPVTAPRAVGTAGRSVPRPLHTRIGTRPTGLNAIFMQFDNARWFSSGRSEELDTTRMERVGDYNGFDVWAAIGDRSRIYLPVTKGGTLVVPYSRKQGR